MSADETELYFTSARRGQQDIFVSTRPSIDAAWGPPVDAGELVNDPTADDFSLRLSNDGLSLYFASTRAGGLGKADLYVSTRPSRRERWGRAANLGATVNTGAFEAFPTPTQDGRTLYFNRSAAFDSSDSDIWITARADVTAPWSSPERLPSGVNGEHAEFSPSVSADGLTLYFASGRGGTIQLWMSHRRRPDDQWEEPQKLADAVNVPGAMTLAPFISANQRSLYFMSARPDAAAAGACTPQTCFERVDLYVAPVSCR